jgi:uncharacterized membrane protein
MIVISTIYRLELAFSIGGAAMFTFILTPSLFRGFDRDLAGRIVGLLFPGYFHWGLVCGGIALICLLLTKPKRWLIATVIIAAMLLITSVQAYIIEHRAAELKKEIPSFVTTPADHPLRQEFKKLHGISAACNLSVIAGGIILIILR